MDQSTDIRFAGPNYTFGRHRGGKERVQVTGEPLICDDKVTARGSTIIRESRV